MPELLFQDKYLNCIQASLEGSNNRVLIYSAYTKKDALTTLASRVKPSSSVTLVVRWNKIDILSGSSDLEIFEICESHGWSLKINPTLHGKLFLFDDSSVILGSANLTKSGLNIGNFGNLEFGAKFNIDEVDVDNLWNFANKSLEINRNLYGLFLNDIAETDPSIPVFHQDWGTEIQQFLAPLPVELWISDCLRSM